MLYPCLRMKIANTKLIIALYLYYLACQKFVKKLHFSNSTSEFLSKQNFFHCFQSDFRPGDLTVMQLIYIVNKIYIALEKGHEVRAVFLDISKAFDKVWHKGLLAKLKSVGISGLLYSWFESYLTLSYHITTGGFTLHYESIFLMVNISAGIYPALKQNPPLKSSQNNLSNGGSSAVKTLHKPKQS